MTKLVNIEELGLSSDNKVYVNKEVDYVYLINNSISIVVKEGISAKFIDKSNNAKIELLALDDSIIKYTIVDSKNTNRSFDISGNLEMLQINISDTLEKLDVELNKEGSEAFIKNLTINKKLNSKYIQYVSHNKPKTISDIKNIAVALDGAGVYFETTGKINKGMANSNCRQISRGVVMDDESVVESKPILLIDEYDCFANHGAAIGKVNDEDLFYLMSRGLNKNDAFLLILSGIINPFITSLDYEEYKDELNEKINKLIEG